MTRLGRACSAVDVHDIGEISSTVSIRPRRPNSTVQSLLTFSSGAPLIVAALTCRWRIATSERMFATMLNNPLVLILALVAIVVAYGIYVIVY